MSDASGPRAALGRGIDHLRNPDAPGSFEWDEIERATGSPTICGNTLALQFDGSITFGAWLDAIEAAEKFVYFENYVIRNDRVGRAFRDALIRKAREGVPVYLIYDWLGCWATPSSYWRPFRQAGVHVRAFNRPSLSLGDPFGVLQRYHRKLVVVDGDVAFVGGFCVGDEWAGTRTEPPWRDTGVEIRGPAVRGAALAFERVWSTIGEPAFHASTLPDPPGEGGTPVWLIEGEPGRARVYRTLHLSATRAKKRIWITDAYFVAPRAISEALVAAAKQGVDVRILVPAHNNWPIVGTISRGGYRFLLENGVRIFEWQGAMIHAKTSVVDGIWSRVGSSNLNGASLMGNWELDVGVLDEDLAGQLEGLFIADLASSVEIVLPKRRASTRDRGRRRSSAGRGGRVDDSRVGAPPKESLDPEGTLPERLEQQLRTIGHAPGRITMASVVRAGTALGEALAGDRTLGREDRTVLGTASIVILVAAAGTAMMPAVVGWGIAALLGWFGVTTGLRAYLQRRRARKEARLEALEAAAEEAEGSSG